MSTHYKANDNIYKAWWGKKSIWISDKKIEVQDCVLNGFNEE